MGWTEGLPGREALLISQNPFFSDERATAPMFVPAGGEPIRMCHYVSLLSPMLSILHIFMNFLDTKT